MCPINDLQSLFTGPIRGVSPNRSSIATLPNSPARLSGLSEEICTVILLGIWGHERAMFLASSAYWRLVCVIQCPQPTIFVPTFGWWDSNPDRKTESCYALVLKLLEASRKATAGYMSRGIGGYSVVGSNGNGASPDQSSIATLPNSPARLSEPTEEICTDVGQCQPD
eukprot:scaffold11875_cov34-Attheya_sp.AAC.1